MNRHTPGPWKAANKPETGDICIWDAESDWAVATACIDRHEAEAEANARLIAAAPTLLAALRPFIQMDEANQEIGAGQWNAAIVMARAAVAKAEGR